jgi:hypothetical protein
LGSAPGRSEARPSRSFAATGWASP